jgi:tetratricopeptide (TPR) repeat protein
LWGAVLTLLLLGGCAADQVTLSGARRLLVAGKVEAACSAFAALAEEDGPRDRHLAALRGWVACVTRSGRLEDVERWLEGRPRDGGRLYGEALVAVAQSPARLPRALDLLSQAGQSWPQVGEIPYRAAVLLLADEQPGPALVLLDRACPLADTAACAVAHAHALLDAARTDEALDQVRRVPHLGPRLADIKRGRALIQRVTARSAVLPPPARDRYSRAKSLLETKDRAGEAVPVLEELLVDFPRTAAAHTLLGLCHLRLGNGADAVVAFRRAAELNPLDATNHLLLAVIYQSRGRPEESAAAFRRALHLDPFLGRAAQQLGEILLQRHSFKEAAAVFDHAQAVDGGSSLSLRLAGRAHLAAGSLEKAELYFDRLSRREPKDFETHLRLAQILLDRCEKQPRTSTDLLARAARHTRQAGAEQPQSPEVEQLEARIRALRPASSEE